jgi:hypothetical protein
LRVYQNGIDVKFYVVVMGHVRFESFL